MIIQHFSDSWKKKSVTFCSAVNISNLVLYWRASVWPVVTCLGCVLARGGGVAERDGSDGPSVWRHARAELSSDPAAQGEGRCQLQADDWEDKIQPAAQVGSRRERRSQRSGNFIWC